MSDEGMDKEDFEGLIAGLRDVAAYQRGAREGFVTHVPATVDVRAIRDQRGQTPAGTFCADFTGDDRQSARGR